MKRIILLFVSIFISWATCGQSLFRYVGNEKDYLTFSEDKIFLSLIDTHNVEMVMKTMGIEKLDNIDNKGTYIAHINRSVNFEYLSEIIGKSENIKFSSPVLISKGQEMGGYSQKIIVKLKHEADIEKVEAIFKEYDLEISQYSEFDRRIVYLYNKTKDAYKNQYISNILHESGMFEYADPNYILFISPTSDPLYQYQWYLKNTGQQGGYTGEDIQAEGAWAITTGSSSVRIAILDSGVDLDHPDLDDNMLSGYDATGGSSNGDDWYFHGTAVASIAAAEGFNSFGTRGVAYTSKIVPILFYNVSSGWTTTESGYLLNAINWVRTGNKAEIINMSFLIEETTSLTSEINTAASSGRGGKGIIFVAATGNSNFSSIGYPSSNSNVISVGASNQYRQRMSPTSSDGLVQTGWTGSNYGTGLDMVAPG